MIKTLKLTFASILALGLLTSTSLTKASAAVVAVVDSGTDFQHDLLKDKVWVNPNEIAGNKVDDDKNGKVDDVNGWNFAEGYDRVFFPEHIAQVNPITYKLFEVIAARQANNATPEQLAFWDKNITALTKDQKADLLIHLNWYGEYAHSTHCSGIIAQRNPNVKLISNRIFPDNQPNQYVHPIPQPPGLMAVPVKGVSEALYWLAATLTDQIFGQVGPYLATQQAQVANYSVGVGIEPIVKAIMKLRGIKNPTEDQISVEVKKAFAKYEVNGKKWMAASPKTLFVVAAGNDGIDTDKLPAYPSSIRVDNEISVAATQGFFLLASFSNYGATTVDIAAPGVAVMSSVPGPTSNMMLPLSGTSMATPWVTGVASAVIDANPSLTPLQVKTILMGTVDKKDWLVGKVVSQGVVNQERAVDAANKTKTMALNDAIAAARTAVADQPEDRPAPALTGKWSFSRTPSFADLDVFAKKVIF